MYGAAEPKSGAVVSTATVMDNPALNHRVDVLGGVLADRLPKKVIITWAQTLNCVATIVMGLIIFHDRVTFWDFIWFGFFNGTILALSLKTAAAI